jgi:gamma-glutamyl:cysteine ligase YbdK (ATP-grasp superfamily)
VRTRCVDNAKKIWWDIRLHPFFDTLEVRVCDAQSRVDDTMAMAAVIQAVIVRLHNCSARTSASASTAAADRRESLARFALSGSMEP